MRPCWKLLALLLAGGAVCPAPGQAQSGFTGVVRIRSTVNARQDTIVQTIKSGRARFDYTCDLVRSCTMLADSGAHTLWLIEHDRKMYVTITQADSWNLEELMRTADPALRARHEAVAKLRDVGELKFKKSKQRSEVAGQRCEVWVGRFPGAGRDEPSEACLGTMGGIALGMLSGVFSSETTVPPMYDENGLPHKAVNSGLLRLRLVEHGQPSTMEVVSIEPGEVDDSLFAWPAGYEHIEMADVIEWIQASQQRAEKGGVSLSPRPGDTLSYPVPDDSRVAQPPTLTACAWESLAPGEYQGEGQVTYQVTPSGVPDTATLTVLQVNGADSRAFRASAQRAVALCRFRPVAGDTNAAPALIRQRIRFSGERIPDAPGSDVVFEANAAPTELQPAAVVRCQPALHEEAVIRVRLIVGTDGRPEPGSIVAVDETTHQPADEAVGALRGCVFTPARYHGVPVRQKVEFTVRLVLGQ